MDCMEAGKKRVGTILPIPDRPSALVPANAARVLNILDRLFNGKIRGDNLDRSVGEDCARISVGRAHLEEYRIPTLFKANYLAAGRSTLRCLKSEKS